MHTPYDIIMYFPGSIKAPLIQPGTSSTPSYSEHENTGQMY